MSERVPFPQANDLDNVIEVVRYIYYNPGCSLGEIAEFLDYEPRIAKYYVDACRYLGLVDQNRMPTARCKHIMGENGLYAVEGVYECVIEDEIMGKVFARCLLEPDSDIESYAQEQVWKYYFDYGATTMERRCQAMIQWCKDIIKYAKYLRPKA